MANDTFVPVCSATHRLGSRRSVAAAGVAMVLAVSGVAAPQGTITLSAGAAPVLVTAPGSKVTVPLLLDMSAAAGLDLASLVAGVTWNPAVLTLDSVRAAVGSLTSNVAGGGATIALYAAQGVTASGALASLYFTAASLTAGTPLRLAPTQAGSESGVGMLGRLRVRPSDVCVAPLGSWGDANGDGAVNVIDAQQIARFAVDLSVGNPAALAAQGDVTDDGAVDIIDAQQIARFSIALSATPRVGTVAPLAPPVSSVDVGPPLSVGVGRRAQLTATPRDAAGTPLNGCAPVRWSSSDASLATVSADGEVTGVAPGAVTLTASAGGRSATLPLSTVLPRALAVAPDTATIHMGETLQLVATEQEPGGPTVPAQSVSYTTSDTTIATVSSTGVLTARTVGLVTITTASPQASATSRVQVSPVPSASLATGESFTCALTVTGAAYCWGRNITGGLGDGTTTSSSVPVRVAAPPGVAFTQISAGWFGACAVSTQHAVYCWGKVNLGAGTQTPILLSSTLRARVVSLGGATFGCSLDLDGALYCWGANSSGVLATGDTISTIAPRLAAGGLTFRSVSAGLVSACALQDSGAAYCWGSPGFRSLGTATPDAVALVPSPVVGGLSFSSLVAGNVYSCGLAASGTYCWGRSIYGSFGTGSTSATLSTVPTLGAGSIPLRSIVLSTGNLAAASTTCGLASDGTAYCWGSNSSGQLGTTESLPDTCTVSVTPFGCTGTPTAVTTSEKFSALATGSETTCGITTTHRLLCWGRNESGQVGDGTTVNRSTPVLVLGIVVWP